MQELVSLYSALFELYCSTGLKTEAEKTANEAIFLYDFRKCLQFSHYQGFIDTAMSHHCNKIARNLVRSALDTLGSQASVSQLGYCYQQLATVCADLGLLREADQYALQWRKVMSDSWKSNLEMLTLTVKIAFLANQKIKLVQYAKEALGLIGTAGGGSPNSVLFLLEVLIEGTMEQKDYAACKDYYGLLIAIKEKGTTPMDTLSELYRNCTKVCILAHAYHEADTRLGKWLSLAPEAVHQDLLSFIFMNVSTLGETDEYIRHMLQIRVTTGVSEVLRRFVRFTEELHGRKSEQMRSAFSFAQKLAANADFPLLATELQCRKDLILSSDGSVALKLAEALLAQGDRLAAEEVCYQYDIPDSERKHMVIIKCSEEFATHQNRRIGALRQK